MKPGTLAAAGTLLTLMTANAKRIPTGACTDRDGKKRYPRPPCDKHGRGPYIGPGRDGKPMYQPCDKPGDCEPELLDDPITRTLHTVGLGMIAIAAVMTLTRRRW